MTDDLLHANGLNALTGAPLLPGLAPADVAALAQGRPIDPEHAKEMGWWRSTTGEDHLGPIEGVDPKDLARAGWAVVFAEGVDPAVREALQPLLDHRQAQAAAANESFFRVFGEGDQAYKPGQTKRGWLKHQQAGPGPADPANVPYYLLLVGDPETIPFRFQYELDVQYAVGRLDFDTAEEYARYARSVVEAETDGPKRQRSAAFWGPRFEGDTSTILSSDFLVAPLARSTRSVQPDWTVDEIRGEAATKSKLCALLGGEPRPALVFAATHGVAFPGDPRMEQKQGALACSPWSPGRNVASDPDFLLQAEDIGADVRPAGAVAFVFACFGAGTPEESAFDNMPGLPRDLASRPFTAALPKRLLGHEKGGALAVVSHVDFAWGYSFAWRGVDRPFSNLQAYESTLRRLLEGHPVGSAMEYFNQRFAELSVDLSEQLDEIQRFGKSPDETELSESWTTYSDARNFVVLGDPAVRPCV